MFCGAGVSHLDDAADGFDVGPFALSFAFNRWGADPMIAFRPRWNVQEQHHAC